MSGASASVRRTFDPVEQVWEIDQDLSTGNLVGASRRLLDLVNNFPNVAWLRKAAEISGMTRTPWGATGGYASAHACADDIRRLAAEVIDQLTRTVPANSPSPAGPTDSTWAAVRLLATFVAGTNAGGDPLLTASVDRLRAHVHRTAPADSVVVECKGIKKQIGQLSLDVSELKVLSGQITGVVAENGHGKTSLLRLIAGELLLRHGAEGDLSYPSLLEGTDAQGWSLRKQQIAYVPQRLPVWHGALRDTLHAEAAMHGVCGLDNHAAVEFIVERLGLGDHLNLRWDQLSGGFQLRFALARALVCRPTLRLLVLDEPLANLDGLVKAALVKDLRHLAGTLQHPIAVVMSSHDIQGIEAVCSQTVVLRSGKAEVFSDLNPVKDGGFCKFEIECDLSAQKLNDRLVGAGITRVEESHLVTLLTAPIDKRAEVPRMLIDRGIALNAFRDITHSVRRVFHES